MASRASEWRKAESEYADRWTFENSNARGKGKGRWVCKACSRSVFHALTPKDPRHALNEHLREVRRHEQGCCR